MARLLDGCTILVFYALLHRISLVPRVLAGAGLVAASLQVTSVAMPLFGHDVVFPMLAPLGLIQLILAVWLIWRGFPEQSSLPSDRPPAETTSFN